MWSLTKENSPALSLSLLSIDLSLAAVTLAMFPPVLNDTHVFTEDEPFRQTYVSIILNMSQLGGVRFLVARRFHQLMPTNNFFEHNKQISSCNCFYI